MSIPEEAGLVGGAGDGVVGGVTMWLSKVA